MESEIFFYHLVPPDLRGRELMPLNELKLHSPDLYQEYYKKYKGREELTLNRVPYLNCLWNDVLMFCPVAPEKIKKELADAGHQRRIWQWYRFNIRSFDIEKLVLLLPAERSLHEYVIPPDSFKKFEVADYVQCLEVTELTKAYYRTVQSGQQVLVWWQLPHILYRGRVSVDEATLVEA